MCPAALNFTTLPSHSVRHPPLRREGNKSAAPTQDGQELPSSRLCRDTSLTGGGEERHPFLYTEILHREGKSEYESLIKSKRAGACPEPLVTVSV